MIKLDGSHGEGGGSILRQALALSILTGKEFTIKGIRANRENPGLAPQHLAALNAAAEVCNAKLWGNALKSTEIYFRPGEFKGGSFKFDIGTAGSITLFLQAVLLPAIFSKKRVSFTVTGGTDVNWSAPFDYFRSVFLPQLRRFGTVEASLSKRGYFPAGGGEVKVSINSRLLHDDILPVILLESSGRLLQVRGVSHASSDLEPAQVAERQAESAKLRLKGLNTPVSILTEYSTTPSTGSGVVLLAIFGEDEIDFNNPVVLGADSLGARAKKAEAVGIEAAEGLSRLIDSHACVDSHLCDQLIPYLAIAGGMLKTDKITEHTLSNIHVAEKFLDVKFEIDGTTIKCNKVHPE